MGYDISYHPITEAEIKQWYWELDFTKIAEKDYSAVKDLAGPYNMDEFYQEKYTDLLDTVADIKPNEAFEHTHGYYIAAIQGFFRKYFYTRGSAFSFLMLEKPEYKKYTKRWEDILPTQVENPIYNQLSSNYSSGVFIPADQVVQLLNDYQNDSQVKQDLDNFYSDRRINIFLNALKFASENNCGILEASDVIVPNPVDLDSSVCYSNLFNCDIEGALLYQEVAREQMKEIEQRENLPEGHMEKNAAYYVSNVTPPDSKPKEEKKGFFQKLFGK
jgi:hypothetical protein